jgi:hypothetical protein
MIKGLVKDFFFEKENIVVELVEKDSNEEYFLNDSDLNDKIESVKTDNFKKFQEQLEKLKTITAMATPLRYQTAMVTSGITLNEIKTNLVTIQNTIKSEIICDYTFTICNSVC